MRGRRLAVVLAVLSVPLVATAASNQAVAAPATFVEVADAPLGNVVVDQGGYAFITNRDQNRVEVLSLATGQLQAPISVGTNTWGLDFSPDFSTLYVANMGGHDVSVVDVASRREVRRIALPPPSPPYGIDHPFSIAVGNNGVALLTTTGNGWDRMLSIELATGIIRYRSDFAYDGHIYEYSYVAASGDRSIIGVVEAGVSSGRVWRYTVATDTFSSGKELNNFTYSVALDGTGSKMLVDGVYQLDSRLLLRSIIPWEGMGVALNAAGTYAYRIRDNEEIDVLDLKRGLVVSRIPVPDTGVYRMGTLALSPDGSRIVVLTETGIATVRTADAVPVPPCTPPAAPEGVVATCDDEFGNNSLMDIVVDGTGHAYVPNRVRNHVEVIDLQRGTREASIPVGSRPAGLDLSADGSLLYVANSGGAEVSVVDVALRKELRRITVPHKPGMNDRPFSVAVANNGTALVSTMFDGWGHTALWEIDLATETVAIREDIWDVNERTVLEASPDRSVIAIVPNGEGDGGIHLYDAASDSIVRKAALQTFLYDVAVTNEAAKVVVSPGTYVLDRDLVLRATIPEGGWGLAVDRAGTTAYRVMPDRVDVLNLGRGLVDRSIPLPEPVGSGPGKVALTPDGSLLAVLTDRGLSMVPTATVPPSPPDDPTTTLRPEQPYSNWAQSSATPLDGLGGWVAVANDPKAAAGQAPATYIYGHVFGFEQGGAKASLSLITDPAGKFAAFAVQEANGTSHVRAVPFNWTAGRYYFPFVYKLAPGVWGAWVYDYAVGQWVPIGSINLPVAWGGLTPASTTTVLWHGEMAHSCRAYPRADVLFYPPYGYRGTTATGSALLGSGVGTGNCETDVSVLFGEWQRYRMGADTLVG